ncbi:hypothetical protein RJT34_01316 [Clitoria ternatea]|uniref:Uncharacterized protein n=1 Tax=Clitoria ternatea TaxID=43366 RepID=A0AAN9KI17_CLITE
MYKHFRITVFSYGIGEWNFLCFACFGSMWKNQSILGIVFHLSESEHDKRYLLFSKDEEEKMSRTTEYGPHHRDAKVVDTLVQVIYLLRLAMLNHH